MVFNLLLLHFKMFGWCVVLYLCPVKLQTCHQKILVSNVFFPTILLRKLMYSSTFAGLKIRGRAGWMEGVVLFRSSSCVKQISKVTRIFIYRCTAYSMIHLFSIHYGLCFKDWIYMRVAPLDKPWKGHQPLQVPDF